MHTAAKAASKKWLAPFQVTLLMGLFGCSASAPPPPDVVPPTPPSSVSALPPPPPLPTVSAPKPKREIETGYLNLGSISLFTPVPSWVRGTRQLHFVYLFCNVDATKARVEVKDFDEKTVGIEASCVSNDRATFFSKSGVSTDSAFLNWARAETNSMDDPPSAAVARDFANRYRGKKPWSDTEADRVVFIRVNRSHLEPELRSTNVCSHTTHPCDESPIRTGRKVFVLDEAVEVKYRGQPFDLSLADHSPIATLVGSRLTYVALSLMVVSERFVEPSGSRGALTPLPWSADVERARSRETAAKSLLALATADDANPQVKVYLVLDRLDIAARLRDLASFKAALADLEAVMTQEGAEADRLKPSMPLFRQIANGELLLEPPAGLGVYLKDSDWY